MKIFTFSLLFLLFTGGIIKAQILISEVVDGTQALSYPRYVEITNEGSSAFNLQNYKLKIFMNGTATTFLYTFPSYNLPAGASLVVTNIDNTSVDQQWTDYNLLAPVHCMYSQTTVIKGNGNDCYQLLNPSDAVIDVYGIPTLDGTGTAWEYTDSYAYRNLNVTSPNSTFTISEWNVAAVDILDGMGSDLSSFLTPGYRALSNGNDILSFTFPEQTGPATINTVQHRVDIEVSSAANLSILAPTIAVSLSATINPLSGEANNFSASPVVYTVTAQDASQQAWNVYVTQAAGASTETDILSFTISGQLYPADINTTSHTVSLVMPFGTNLTSLIPSITVSPGAGIFPLSGSSQNFSAPFIYTVTAENNVTVQDWTVTVLAGPYLSVTPSVINGLTYLFGSGPSASQSYSLSGSNLSGYPGNITVTAPADYRISLDNITFSTGLSIPYTSSTLSSTTVYVRLIAGLAINTYNSELITNSGGGAATVNVSCNGSVTSVPAPILTASTYALSGFTYVTGSGPSVSQSYSLSGINLTGFPGNISVTAPSHYEVSLDNITFTSGVSIPYTSSSLNSTTVYVRLIAGLAVNSYNSELIINSGGGSATVNVACNGSVTSVPSPVLSASSSALSGFTYVTGNGPSASQSYSLSGSNLTGFPGNITVTAPSDYEVSADNITFTSGISIPYTGSTLSSTTVYVRLKAGLTVNNYNSEIITNSGGGAANVNVSCNGSVTSLPPASLTTGVSVLNGFTYFEGSGPSASQSYDIEGANLTGFPGNITITAPGDYELSLDNSTFLPALSVPFTSSTLASVTVYVRLKSGLPVGLYDSETITNTGGGASVDIICNGEVEAVLISCATDLFISEYHEPSSGNNKGVEVYNGTGADVDLTGYYIGLISNGGTDVETSQALSGILGDKQTVCVYNDADADVNFRLKGDINIVWGGAQWNGDDAVYLLKGGNTSAFIIDAIGDIPPVTDPGTEFVNNGVSTLNTVLIRKDTVSSPSTTWSGLEWNVVAAGTYSDWGTHTLDCPTNIQNNELTGNMELFPNPNNGSFSLVLPENSDFSEIRILNVVGSVVYENTVISSDYQLKLESGIYILQVFGKQVKLVKKFVVY